MNPICHFFHIHCLVFHLKKIFLPSKIEKILLINKFLKVPPSEPLKRFSFLKIMMTLASYKTLDFES
jgi:hypothetical protein